MSDTNNWAVCSVHSKPDEKRHGQPADNIGVDA